METLKFKTNIKCTGCIDKVTPFLKDEKGIGKWEVDILNPEKILSVEIDGINPDKIIETIEKAGFKAEIKS